MYCEYCGRKLNDGEICPCRRKKFNVKMFISFLFGAAGAGCFFYFRLNEAAILNMAFVKGFGIIKEYVCYIMSAVVFFIGWIIGILAVKRGVFKGLSRIIMLGNLIGFLIMFGLMGWSYFHNHQVERLLSGELTLEAKNQLIEAYYKEDLDDDLKSEIESRFAENILTIGELYSQGNITSEEAKNNLSIIFALYEKADENTKNIMKKNALKYANDVVGNFNTNKITYTDANLELEILEDFPAISNDLRELKSNMDSLNDAKTVSINIINEENPEIQQSETSTFIDSWNNANEIGIHSYDYFLTEGTWEDAYLDCIKRGGHLVRFNNQEEYDYVVKELNDNNLTNYHFFIGGRRDLDSLEYYWVDDTNAIVGEALNDSHMWCGANWLTGEPSFMSRDYAEHVLDVFFSKDENRWVWNDVANNLPDTDPYYDGKVGYICEYED